jgi:hypothetical protein
MITRRTNVRGYAKRHLPVVAGVLLFSLIASVQQGFSRFDLPQIEWQTRIGGQDHKVLKRYFAGLEQGKMKTAPDTKAKAILLERVSEEYRKGCNELTDRWRKMSAGVVGLDVRLLYVQAGKEEKPTRVLLAYSCFLDQTEKDRSVRDERLASLVVDKESSNLSVIAQERNCLTGSDLVHIAPEKEVKIGGKSVVGLGFTALHDSLCLPSSFATLREERIRFFLFDDEGITVAGSVLKAREESVHDPEKGDVRSVYDAGLVFKKDMKGNIVGILSPYTVKRNNRPSEKGMLRLLWSGERGEFIPE